jgi:hypothetical protein
MAEYHSGLKYHEDTVNKRNITEEEINFLNDLQKEMNTQDNLCQADPRFWAIKGTEKLYHVEETDGYELYDSDCCETLASSTKGICDYINEELLDEINSNRLEGEYFTVEYEKGVFGNDKIVVNWLDGGCEDEPMSEELEDLHDIRNWLEEQGFDYNVISYKIIPKIYEDTMFLTQKAAEDHLRSNYYHYSEDAHTYAMTSWRNYETSKLWKILQEVDWNSIKVGDNNE